jgi:hypothetical protein
LAKSLSYEVPHYAIEKQNRRKRGNEKDKNERKRKVQKERKKRENVIKIEEETEAREAERRRKVAKVETERKNRKKIKTKESKGERVSDVTVCPITRGYCATAGPSVSLCPVLTLRSSVRSSTAERYRTRLPYPFVSVSVTVPC